VTRFLLPLIAVLVFVPVLWLGLQNDPRALPSQYIGKPAPRFSLPLLSDPNRQFSSADLLGQVSVVNIWATWCVGCRAEHAFLLELARDSDIPIYGIDWRDKKEDALRWLEQLGDPYTMTGFDADGRVGIDWGVYGAPETFLIDPLGNVVYRHTGPLSWPIWEAEFVPRIAAIPTT